MVGLALWLSSARPPSRFLMPRVLSLTEPPPHTSSLHTVGMKDHYVTLLVGQPPQRQTLVVSIDSPYTSLPCADCTNCVTESPEFLYDYNASIRSYVHKCPQECFHSDFTCQGGSNQCHVVVEGSPSAAEANAKLGYRGYQVTDRAELDWSQWHLASDPIEPASHHPFPLSFICQRTLDEASPFSGILSMSSSPGSFLNQMFASGRIHQRVFSLCFAESSLGGQLTLGGHDPSSYNTPLVWAKNAASSPTIASLEHSSYAVNIRRIYLGLGGGDDPLRAAANGYMSMVPLDKKMADVDDSSNPSTPTGTAHPIVRYDFLDGRRGMVHLRTRQTESNLHSSIEEAFRCVFSVMTGGIEYSERGLEDIASDELSRLPTIFLQMEVRSRKRKFYSLRFLIVLTHLFPSRIVPTNVAS